MAPPDTERAPPRRAKFSFYFFYLIVGCAFIGGLALLILNLHDDMTYMVQLEQSDDDGKLIRSDILVDSLQQPVKVKKWCSICLFPLNAINNTTRQLGCGHEFHKDCIQTQGSCPLCKTINNSRES